MMPTTRHDRHKMLLRETIHRTKIFFCKTLQNLKSFFSERYKKLPKPPSFNPFCCGGLNPKDHQRDLFYTDFCDEWEANLYKAKESYNGSIIASKEPRNGEDACSENFMMLEKHSPVKSTQEGVVEEKKTRELQTTEKREESCSKNMIGASTTMLQFGGGHGLAQKIKDLEMVEAGDMEQVLDVEEALHYYSRLTSPVYQDIVDKFFTDMYTDFSVPQVPQASTSINSSKRRLDSIRL